MASNFCCGVGAGGAAAAPAARRFPLLSDDLHRECGFSGDDRIAVGQQRSSHSGSVDPRSVGAVQIAQHAALVIARDLKVNGGHMAVIAERELSSRRATNAQRMARLHGDSSSG
jgi:hypothetical protein